MLLLFVFGKNFADICLKMLLHYKLASLNFTLYVSEYVTTNVPAKRVTFPHETRHGCRPTV